MKWFFIGVIILVWVVAINIFPADHIIIGGDVVQLLNAAENFGDGWYEWFGRATLFSAPFFLLDKAGISETAQLSWYLGIFLFGSYLSFWIFSRLVFSRAPQYLHALLSLFYALNLYTLYIFTSTWGFTAYQSLYIFIPALTGLFLSALQKNEWRYPVGFLFAAFLASGSFSNPAFALSLGIYFALLTASAFIFRVAPITKKTVYTASLLAVGAVAFNAYWLFPSAIQIRAGVESVETSPDIVLSDALSKTSNTIFDTLRMVQTFEAEKFYPYNFPYPSIEWLERWVVILSFVPIFFIFFGAFFKRRSGEKRVIALLFFLLAAFVVLVARVRFPFEAINTFLFHLPVLNVLRGYDKMAIFTPFLISALLLGTLAAWQGKRYYRIALAVFCGAAFLLALPFFAGGIQTKLSYIFAGSKEKDFREANYKTLVKIPEEYRDIEGIFREDESDGKISMLPYSPGSAIGRVKLLDLGVNAPHFAHHLYRAPYIEPNDYFFDVWKPAEEFSESVYNPQWIIDLYGLRGVKYIIYHKDVSADMEKGVEYLGAIGALHPTVENENFTVYEIDSARVFPLVYSFTGSPLTIRPDDRNLYKKIESYRQSVTTLIYTKKNPLEVTVDEFSGGGDTIVFNEKYDPLWRAEYGAPDGTRTELERNEKVRYANGWKTEKGMKEGSIRVYHTSLPLLRIGGWASAAAFGILMGWGGFVLAKFLRDRAVKRIILGKHK